MEERLRATYAAVTSETSYSPPPSMLVGVALPPRERLEQRPAAIWRGRRRVRVACAIVAAVAIAVVALVVILPGTGGHRSIETSARPVPTTVPTRLPDVFPTVTVTPHHGLRDGDTVTVRADRFPPFQVVRVSVCSKGTYVCDAVDVPTKPIGRNGSLSLTHRVWSVFSSDGTLHDCRSVVCVVRFGSFEVPISFSPRKRAASYPQLTLDPAGPYTDGQQVTVTVDGWPGSIGHRPDLAIEHLTVGQCGRFHPPPGTLPYIGGSGAVCDGEISLRREPDGRYTATLTVHRSIAIPSDPTDPTDCTQPGNCQVALVLTPHGPIGEPPSEILGVDVVVT
jgi:hypothetical protein